MKALRLLSSGESMLRLRLLRARTREKSCMRDLLLGHHPEPASGVRCWAVERSGWQVIASTLRGRSGCELGRERCLPGRSCIAMGAWFHRDGYAGYQSFDGSWLA